MSGKISVEKAAKAVPNQRAIKPEKRKTTDSKEPESPSSADRPPTEPDADPVEPEALPASEASRLAQNAMNVMKKIESSDPKREEAFQKLFGYILDNYPNLW